MNEGKRLTGNTDSKNRRAILKGLVAGSAVVSGTKAIPENWTKPLTNSVVLPGHANTTIGDYQGGDGGRSEDGDSENYTNPGDYDQDGGDDSSDGEDFSSDTDYYTYDYADGADEGLDYGTDGYDNTVYDHGDYENDSDHESEGDDFEYSSSKL